MGGAFGGVGGVGLGGLDALPPPQPHASRGVSGGVGGIKCSALDVDVRPNSGLRDGAWRRVNGVTGVKGYMLLGERVENRGAEATSLRICVRDIRSFGFSAKHPERMSTTAGESGRLRPRQAGSWRYPLNVLSSRLACAHGFNTHARLTRIMPRDHRSACTDEYESTACVRPPWHSGER